jgi:arylsulfatase
VPEDFAYPQGLYDLRRDRAEQYDVQKENPEIVAELMKIAEEAREDLGDNITNRKGQNNRAAGKID